MMRETLRNAETGDDSVANVITSIDKSHLLRPEMAGMETAKIKKAAYVRILEQPASKGLRFRYECEGRSAGSIPGTSSSQENKTFPTIQVIGYTGKAVVVVSCVTNEAPYKSHPHNLVGKEGCKKGVCTIHMNEDMTASFPNLGIQCVKKKDIDESLTLRQQIRVDPFQSGFAHKASAQSIDLNCVRLANSSPVIVVMSLEPSDLLEPLLSLMEDPSVREGVADTARLFFQSSTATVNLIPSFIILGGLLTALLSALGIPILSSLGINLTGSGSSNGGYGAPASSYGLSASGYSRGDFDTQVTYLQEQINALVASSDALTNQVYYSGDTDNIAYTNNLISSS